MWKDIVMKNINKRKTKIGKIIFLVVLVLIILIILVGIIAFKHYYNLMDIQLKDFNTESSQEFRDPHNLQNLMQDTFFASSRDDPYANSS